MALPVITSNSPSTGYISWTGFSIQYAGTSYPVAASNTNKKFTWWKYNTGTPTVNVGDTLPNDLTADDILLFLNKNGVGVLAPTASVVDGALIVSGSILADAIAANQIQAWHLNANSVTANALSASAVTADKLAAGAVTASKLSIGAVSDNMVLNGSFEDGTQGWQLGVPGGGWTAGTADIVTGVASSGTNALRITYGTGITAVSQAPSAAIPVAATAGRTWYISAVAGASAIISGNPFRMYAYWLDANKQVVTYTVLPGGDLSTTWQRFEGVVTPPPTARYLSVVVANVVNAAIFVDSVEAMEVTVSAQIADGAITTPKLVASAVTADKLAVGAVTADKISVGALDGKQITGGTYRTTGIASGGAGIQYDDTGLRAYKQYGSAGNGELLADPGFEAQTVGSATTGPWSSSGDISIQAAPYRRTGSRAAAFRPGSSWTSLSQTVTVEPGTTITPSIWMCAETAGLTTTVTLTLTDPAGTTLANTAFSVTSTAWTQFSPGAVAVPAGVSSVTFTLSSSTRTPWIDIDDASMVGQVPQIKTFDLNAVTGDAFQRGVFESGDPAQARVRIDQQGGFGRIQFLRAFGAYENARVESFGNDDGVTIHGGRRSSSSPYATLDVTGNSAGMTARDSSGVGTSALGIFGNSVTIQGGLSNTIYPSRMSEDTNTVNYDVGTGMNGLVTTFTVLQVNNIAIGANNYKVFNFNWKRYLSDTSNIDVGSYAAFPVVIGGAIEAPKINSLTGTRLSIAVDNLSAGDMTIGLSVLVIRI